MSTSVNSYFSTLAGDLTVLSCGGPSGPVNFGASTAAYTITPNATCTELISLTADIVCVDSASSKTIDVSANELAQFSPGQHSYPLSVDQSVFGVVTSTYACYLQYHGQLVCNRASGSTGDRLCQLDLQGSNPSVFPGIGIAAGTQPGAAGGNGTPGSTNTSSAVPTASTVPSTTNATTSTMPMSSGFSTIITSVAVTPTASPSSTPSSSDAKILKKPAMVALTIFALFGVTAFM